MNTLTGRGETQKTPHRCAVWCVGAWEAYYRSRHGLEAVGPLFLVGSSAHEGVPKHFADGSILQTGERYGVLHFNNARLAQLGAGAGRLPTAWEFTRLLRSSLVALAEFAATADGSRLGAYQGTTWMQPHGLKVGFEIEALPAGWRTAWLRFHFYVLQRCFSPASFRQHKALPEPRLFWITRTALRQHFAG